MDTPDDVRELELILAEAVAHTESREAAGDFLECKRIELATVQARWAEARSRGYRGDADALAAADAWGHVVRVIGAARDDLWATERGRVWLPGVAVIFVERT